MKQNLILKRFKFLTANYMLTYLKTVACIMVGLLVKVRINFRSMFLSTELLYFLKPRRKFIARVY